MQYLIGKADATTEKDSTDNKHGEVLRGAVKDDAGDEEQARRKHGESASQAAGGIRSEQGGREAGQVERRREQLQTLVVELAVAALLDCILLQFQYRRKELTKKVIHRRHAAF